MPHDQQVAAIGASNYKLLKDGVVSWDDIVTRSRVRDLREVVSRKALTVQQMTAAGVSPRIAEQAHASVHTAAHELAERKRLELLAGLTAAGANQADLIKHLGGTLASRVGIAEGPNGAWSASRVRPPGGFGPGHAAELAALLRGGPAETGGTETESGDRRRSGTGLRSRGRADASVAGLRAGKPAQAAADVPESERWTPKKIWIIDAYEAFRKKYPGATLDDFKRMLAEANNARLIDLTRMDMPGALSKSDRLKDAASQVEWGPALFHLIRLP